MPRIRIVEVSMFGTQVSRHPITEIDRQRVIRDADGNELLAVQPSLAEDGTLTPGEEDVLEIVLAVNAKPKSMGFAPRLRGTGTVTGPSNGPGSEDYDSKRESLGDPEE